LENEYGNFWRHHVYELSHTLSADVLGQVPKIICPAAANFPECEESVDSRKHTFRFVFASKNIQQHCRLVDSTNYFSNMCVRPSQRLQGTDVYFAFHGELPGVLRCERTRAKRQMAKQLAGETS
jgi:hypothetical protein